MNRTLFQLTVLTCLGVLIGEIYGFGIAIVQLLASK